jgi:PAS domain S-box-containing protein/putative nucleotidyltransferase with HDIG domain
MGKTKDLKKKVLPKKGECCSTKEFLNKQNNIYKEIFQNSPEGAYLATPTGRLLKVNPALANLLGYEKPAELIKNLKSIQNICYFKPETNEKLFHLIKEKSVVKGYETQVYKKDGSKIWISANIMTIRNSKGEQVFYAGSIQDISHRKKQIDELLQSEANLAEMLRKAEEDRDFYEDTLKDMCSAYQNLDEFYIGVIEAISCALDDRYKWSHGHSQRVASYATAIAKAIDMNEEEIETLKIAALLHDIGKICALDIFADNKSNITPEEYEIIKKHPAYGASMLERIKYRKEIIPIIRHHHERIDGKGYPDGLKGEDIPLCARILHLAESYDSMTVDRPYRRAPGKEFAISEFKRCTNTQFDPKLAEIAIKVL